MTEMHIHPLGEIDVGTFDSDGETFTVIRMEDRRNDDRVEITLQLPAFVALADHLKMLADDLIAEQKSQP